MSRHVPAESDLLCEFCGYTLNGLPTVGNCPECGTPVELSVTASGRALCGFELRPGASSFLATTIAVLFRTRRFYRGLITRTSHPAAGWFARRHRNLAALLFALAALGHVLTMLDGFGVQRIGIGMETRAVTALVIPAIVLTYLLLAGITSLATWLSSMEGRYWGMRLPLPVVRRCLQFHTACYLPIGLAANLVVWGYRIAVRSNMLSPIYGMQYLVVLCILVLLSGAYLFRAYLVAMRNVRYANA